MGTTLTGTTPQNTYDSLIKVTDNGPIGSTPKYLSDGLGTDSSLALSTKNILIGTTTAVVNYGRELTVDATALTSEPEAFLALKGNRGSGNVSAIQFLNGSEQVGNIVAQAEGNMRFLTGTTTANTSEKVRITSAGNVGIGTSSPDTKLTTLVADNAFAAKFKATNGVFRILPFETGLGVKVSAVNGAENAFEALALQGSSHQFVVGVTEVARVTSNGLTFNGDTAAANALDDYEEGTWTPTISFGGASTGITYAASRAGQYTKVGRQVTLTAYILLTNKGTSTGAASIGGLPFVIGSTSGYYSSVSFSAISQISYVGMLQGYGEINTQRIDLVETTEAGVQSNITDADFTNVTQLLINFTYFV